MPEEMSALKRGKLPVSIRASDVIAFAQQLRASALAHQPWLRVFSREVGVEAPSEKQTATARIETSTNLVQKVKRDGVAISRLL